MKIKILSHLFTGRSLTMVFSDGKKTTTKIVEQSHPNWSEIVELYKQAKYVELVPLFDMDAAIQSKFKGKFTVFGGQVCYNGLPVKGYLIDRILFFMRELPKQTDRLIKFAENLYSNPSPAVIEQLYKFLEHQNMPITEDGCFLAYKGVGNDYYSRTAGDLKIIKGKVKGGRVYNAVGQEIIAERANVCDDKNQGCARGLHVGSYDYANNFKGNGRLMIIKVNPRDAVSVPHDESWKKLRACRYEVIAEEDGRLSEVYDIDYDKRKPQRFTRDSLGRFSSVCRDKSGRFCPKDN